MALIQRNITVPKHAELMGFGVTPSQTSLNNFIKDIHQVMIDTGISVLDMPGDIDFNNIPNLFIANKALLKDIPRNEFFSVGHKYYAFNDDNQSEYPIFIKFDFGVQCVSNLNEPNLLYTTIKLDILRSLDPEDKIYDSNYLMYTFIYYTTSTNTKNLETYNSTLATCFYNKENFYFNVFPKSKIVAMQYESGFNSSKLAPYMAFYIERNRNTTNYMQLSYGKYVTTSSNPVNLQNSQREVFINNILHNTEIIKTNSTVTIPLMGFVDTISNNYEIGGINAIAFKTILYDKSTKSIEPNYNILCTYSSQIGQSNVKYEIELDDGSFGKYISYSLVDSVNNFPDTKTDFLFRYE